MKIETFVKRFLDPKKVKKAVEIWNCYLFELMDYDFKYPPAIDETKDFDRIWENAPSDIVDMVYWANIPRDWKEYTYNAYNEDGTFKFFNYIEEYGVFVDFIEKNGWEGIYNFAMENGYKI